MALADVMQAIEEARFSAEVNLAAGMKAFRRGLRNHDLVRQLAGLAKAPQARSQIVKRIAALSAAEIDQHYENPFDAALSAYLTVLGDTGERDLITEAASAAESAPNCWWTVGIAHELQMRASATGQGRSGSVVYFDANVLTPGTRGLVEPCELEAAGTTADNTRDDLSWLGNSLEAASKAIGAYAKQQASSVKSLTSAACVENLSAVGLLPSALPQALDVPIDTGTYGSPGAEKQWLRSYRKVVPIASKRGATARTRRPATVRRHFAYARCAR